MFRKLALTATIVCFTLPVFTSGAHATSQPGSVQAEETTFVHDGVNYRYTTRHTADGRRVLTGVARGKPFRLVVGPTRVKGTYDSQPVEFRLSEVPTSKIPAALER